MPDYQLSPLLVVLWFAFAAVMIVADWKIYTKAGKPGWAIFVPFYNIFVMLDIVGKPAWWFVMLLIPGVNIVFAIMIVYNLVLKFGQPGWHVLLAIFVSIVYYPYLAFSKASYEG